MGCWAVLGFALSGGKQVSIGVNGGFGLVFTLMLVVTGRIAGSEMALQHHSSGYINVRSGLMRMIVAAAGSKATHVFLSMSMVEAFRAVYGPIESAVVSNAYLIDPPPRSSATNNGNGSFRLGHLSNLSREKGLYRFIDLCRRLAERGVHFEAQLAGPVVNPQDRAAIEAAMQDLSNFTYSGPLYGEDKVTFFAGLDLFVFPTEYRFEAQPIVLYEAMAQGVPVLSVDRGFIREQASGCFKVFDSLAAFENGAPQLVANLASQDRAVLREARRKARAKFDTDAQDGQDTLRRLFGLTGKRVTP